MEERKLDCFVASAPRNDAVRFRFNFKTTCAVMMGFHHTMALNHRWTPLPYPAARALRIVASTISAARVLGVALPVDMIASIFSNAST